MRARRMPPARLCAVFKFIRRPRQHGDRPAAVDKCAVVDVVPRVCGEDAIDLLAASDLQISAGGHFDAENTEAVLPVPSGLAPKAG